MGAKGTVLLLVAALVLLVAGCGSDDEAELSPRAANEGLITEKDLSGKVTSEESSPTEPCGPLPIFKENEAKKAITRLFPTGPLVLEDRQMRLKEAVGAFEEEENAEAAYDELTAQERYDCIRQSSEASSTVEDKVEVSEPQSLGFGEEDAFVRFHEIDPQSPLPYALDVMTIRNGRCVASLIFLPREQEPSDATAREVGKTVAERLETVCG